MSFVFFDRMGELRVGIPANPQGTIMGVGRGWTDLRLEFEVTRSLGKEPNTASIKLFNPDEVSIGLIQGTGAFVQLLAGYFPLPSMIFSGNIARRGVNVEKDGVDKIITIEAGDGELSYVESSFNWHYSAGTPVNLVLTNLLVSLGVGLGPGSPVLPPRILPNDVSYFGRAVDVLDELVTDAGGTWSIQDGNLEILLEDAPTAELAVSLTPETGLIGTPTRTDDGVTIESLLHPGIKPGKPLNVLSFQTVGFFKPKVVKHRGDTHGGDWRTEVEAVPLG
jgi:hypothetical protein